MGRKGKKIQDREIIDLKIALGLGEFENYKYLRFQKLKKDLNSFIVLKLAIENPLISFSC